MPFGANRNTRHAHSDRHGVSLVNITAGVPLVNITANITASALHEADELPLWREAHVAMQLMFVVLFLSLLGGLVWWTEQREKRRLALARAKAMLKDDTHELMNAGGSDCSSTAELAENATDTVIIEGMDGVRHELTKLRLAKYADAFEQHGFDHWPEILRLPRDRFAKLVKLTDMTPNHVDRLQEQLKVQRRASGIQRAAREEKPGEDAFEESCVIL